MYFVLLSYLIIATSCSSHVHNEYVKIDNTYVDSIVKDFHNKYNSGENMLEDSRIHYFLVDSILNKVEASVKDCIKDKDTSFFINNNKNWHLQKDSLIEKEQYFFDENFRTGNWGSDMYMILYYNVADFIVKRIKSLLKYKEDNCYP